MRVLLASLILASLGMGTADSLVYSGIAYEKDGDGLIYQEKHKEVLDKGRLIKSRTVYLDFRNNILAERTLDFSNSALCPDYKLEDKRTGYAEFAAINQNGIHVGYRDAGKTEFREKTLHVPEPSVIDGGFNYFVKAHFSEVLMGKTVGFYFVAPARLDYYHFRLRKGQELSVDGKKMIQIILEPESFILRALIDPIVLTYNPEKKRLVEYAGISNLLDKNGKAYLVRLKYPELGP